MTDICPECKRERDRLACHMALLLCPGENDPVCVMIATTYHRGFTDGLKAGVDLAKQTARPTTTLHYPWGDCSLPVSEPVIDWTETNKAAHQKLNGNL